MKFKYFNRAVRLRLSNRTVTSRCNNRYSIAVALLEIICEKERKARLVRKKKEIVKVDDLLFLLLTSGLTYTLQQNRNPLLKILDPPLHAHGGLVLVSQAGPE